LQASGLKAPLTAEPPIIFGTFSLPGLGGAGGAKKRGKDEE
jgi:hypothetical protein